MLTMTQVDFIRKMFYSQGMKVSEIEKELNYDRKTIEKYLDKEDWNIPIQTIKKEATFAKLEPVKPIINGWLTEDKSAKRKQRHTAKRVFDRLQKEYSSIFDCSYRTVAGYVANKKKEIYSFEEGFLPLKHIRGEAQLDFGDAQFYENGCLYDGKYLNISFPNNNQGFMQLYKGENAQCLYDGMKNIFQHIGKAPYKIWFDNTSAIVTDILKNRKRNVTEDFLRFKMHYGFEAVFCNPGKGNEKGNVENKVGYHRRNLLVPVPRFENLQEYNKKLLQMCDEDGNRDHYRKNDTIATLFAEDMSALLPLPAIELDTSKYLTIKTNGYGKFLMYKGLHEYSVSPKYAKTTVLVKLTAFEVIVLDESHREIITHKRLYGMLKQESMNWIPYLSQIAKRPAALKYTGIYDMMPKELKEYLNHCNYEDKGQMLKTLATVTKRNGFEQALVTVKNALQYGVFDHESILRLNSALFCDQVHMPPLKLSIALPQLPQIIPQLRLYDAVIESAGGINVQK